MPVREVHQFINDLVRPIGAYLYGRRMYEVMVGWETAQAFAGQSPTMLDFATICRAAAKVVYSRSRFAFRFPDSHLLSRSDLNNERG